MFPILHFILLTSLYSLLAYQPATGAGINQGSSRVVNGRPATPGEFPYQASIRCGTRHFCGGSLVEVAGRQFSAAHCVSPPPCKDVTVVVGDLELSSISGWEQSRTADKIIVHDNYLSIGSADIALLFFEEKFQMTDYVKTIDLATKEDEEAISGDTDVIVSGWGALYASGASPDALQTAVLPVIPNPICEELWGEMGVHIDDDILCAGWGNGSTYVCYGDSGGPARTITNKLTGIVSFGDRECGENLVPAGFTRISSYLAWINEQVETKMSKTNPR